MRVLIALILVLSHLVSSEKKLIIKEKTISVSGQTSLGSFKCDYLNQGFKDTLFINSAQSREPIVFDIPVHEFGCGNFLLNKDFRKTIKADEYPHAKVRVNNLQTKGKDYTCDVLVNIVGKRLHYKALHLSNGGKQLKGEIVINFDELGLEPPKKLGGLIKVEDKLALEIKLGF
ncbi:hypothetical protein Belba_2666 [Belliella baltica DSM 15883]|uniref:Lipid/polyisoprenoid-binding YceI-like domain-containing protein n=1 Tax=Belliella baltica (strain DSM 15883 / CIP 108006 / LMG 21964 / BA134) TaxID=866536 RepID=I3Z7J2_BELBD|nr:hypothetical protein [Belliella baltica]AFL85210.1 hypothetical protein Belba_2666 [Belliella baltica DSM 15883]